MILMLSYDLNGYERSEAYQAIEAVIKGNCITCAHPLKSQWLVETILDADWWNSALLKVMDANDRLLVSRLYPGTYAGYLDREIWDWLNACWQRESALNAYAR